MGSVDQLSRRHGMHEFGTVCGITEEVRVNSLEARLLPNVPFPHRHDFYHMVVVNSGRGWHEIDFHRYKVHSHQIFFMKPGQVHSWSLDSKTSGFVIEFGSSSLPEISELPKPLELDDEFDLSKRHSTARRSLFLLSKQMLEEYNRQELGFEFSLKHYLVPFLIGLGRLSAAKKPVRRATDPVIERFLNLLEEYFYSHHRVSFYSEKMRITAKALTMRAARVLGRSARAVIQERCLLESKRLLAYSDLTVAEIGFKLGFDDPNYFSRFFKSVTRLTPGEFRAKAMKSGIE